MSVMDDIRQRQASAGLPENYVPPKHQPEILYIGCVDARLDPIDDIGIGKGKALIFRNVGAIVLQATPEDESGKLAVTEGHVPQNVSIGAVLEFFLNHIALGPSGLKHIVVSGHTDCNGLKACLHSKAKPEDQYLPFYLENLSFVRDRIQKQAAALKWSEVETVQALEKESVRQSIVNLLSYPVVKHAVEAGTLELHGWIIDTATQRLSEMNPETLEFEPMTAR